jgi:hypothetical protein
MYRTAQVSLTLIILGVVNLLVFIPTYAAGRSGSDFQHFWEAVISIGCMIFSAILYAAGLMCTAAAMKAKRDVGRAVVGMVAGDSGLIWWFLAHVLKLY